tara:strand:- start:381 stop:674 length:294 start_codon:yes stop_codon:yes gene_type:complete
MSNQTETVFAEGFFVTDAREGAPEFVMGAVSISQEKAIAFINEHANEKGYVNLDLLRGKSGQPYLKLNDFVPTPRAEDTPAPAVVEVAEASSADLPF